MSDLFANPFPGSTDSAFTPGILTFAAALRPECAGFRVFELATLQIQRIQLIEAPIVHHHDAVRLV